MKKLLQISKISPHGRVYIGQKTMELLNAQVGDRIQIVEDGEILRISKVEA